jgi:chloramphenicol O-acetyltransferase type A
LKAANSIEEFRLRLRESRVWLHDEIHASSTILLEDGSLAFSFFKNSEDPAEFLLQAQDALRHQTEHPSLTEWDDRDDVLFITSLPWIEFTSFTNPQRSALDSIPKIAFGKYVSEGGAWWMPISVEVHHALVDGIHVSRFLDSFQRNLSHSC